MTREEFELKLMLMGWSVSVRRTNVIKRVGVVFNYKTVWLPTNDISTWSHKVNILTGGPASIDFNICKIPTDKCYYESIIEIISKGKSNVRS